MLDEFKDKKWLVKNNNKIIGPFSEEELQRELAKDYISPFATICVPGRCFWGFIAAEPKFANHTNVLKLTKFKRTLPANFTRTHKMISDHIETKYPKKKNSRPLSDMSSAPVPAPPAEKKVNSFLKICLVIFTVVGLVWFVARFF